MQQQSSVIDDWLDQLWGPNGEVPKQTTRRSSIDCNRLPVHARRRSSWTVSDILPLVDANQVVESSGMSYPVQGAVQAPHAPPTDDAVSAGASSRKRNLAVMTQQASAKSPAPESQSDLAAGHKFAFEPVNFEELYPDQYEADPAELRKFLWKPDAKTTSEPLQSQQSARMQAHAQPHNAAAGGGLISTFSQAVTFTGNLLTRVRRASQVLVGGGRRDPSNESNANDGGTLPIPAGRPRRGSIEVFAGLGLYDPPPGGMPAPAIAAGGAAVAPCSSQLVTAANVPQPEHRNSFDYVRRSSIDFLTGGLSFFTDSTPTPTGAAGWAISPAAQAGANASPLVPSVNAADYVSSGGPGQPSLLEIEAEARGGGGGVQWRGSVARQASASRRASARGLVGAGPGLSGVAGDMVHGGAARLGTDPYATREQFKLDAIEVASFLHQVQADSLSINEMTAMAKPKPVAQQPGQQRRTGSGTVYPSATPFQENSNVGICMLLPSGLEPGSVVLVLEEFYKRCPLDEHLTCVRWGDETRGVPRKKKAGAAGADKARTGNKFDHCCFVSMSLPNGFEHVSVKVFKTGRLQTAGCRDGDMSLAACRLVAGAFECMAADGHSLPLWQYGPMWRGTTGTQFLHQLSADAPHNTRLEKESILGVFDLGFKERGFNVDMEQLRALLSHPDNSDRVCKVHQPKADAKEKVKRFQGLGVYINKDCLTESSNNVFVNIFPTGKCTVTAANSRQQAEQVTEVVSRLIIDCFVQCRKREMEAEQSKAKKARRR